MQKKFFCYYENQNMTMISIRQNRFNEMSILCIEKDKNKR